MGYRNRKVWYPMFLYGKRIGSSSAKSKPNMAEKSL